MGIGRRYKTASGRRSSASRHITLHRNSQPSTQSKTKKSKCWNLNSVSHLLPPQVKRSTNVSTMCVFSGLKSLGVAPAKRKCRYPRIPGEFSQRLTLRGLHSLAGMGESTGEENARGRDALQFYCREIGSGWKPRQGVHSLLVPDTERT